jgi:hypothetical protein
MDLVHNLGPPVDHSHNVFQITAHTEIVITAPMKCFQLGREKIRCGDDLDLALA